MHFFAFKYWDTESTTTGESNPKNGRMSIAGDIAIFSKKTFRDTWVTDQSDYIKVSALKARNLCAGYSRTDFNEIIRMTVDHQIENE